MVAALGVIVRVDVDEAGVVLVVDVAAAAVSDAGFGVEDVAVE